MRTWNALLAAGFTGSLLAAYPLVGAANVNVDISPPTAPVEVAPPRDDTIYVPGYWDWDDAHHIVWKEGKYIRNRPGYYWVPDAWEKRNGH